MAKESSLKIQIASRTYSLRVNGSEETIVSKAAALINDKIKEFAHHYSVKDQQDLLAMSCLHFATEAMNQEKSKEKAEQEMLQSLDSWMDKMRKCIADANKSEKVNFQSEGH